jgi:hypothetical protein
MAHSRPQPSWYSLLMYRPQLDLLTVVGGAHRLDANHPEPEESAVTALACCPQLRRVNDGRGGLAAPHYGQRPEPRQRADGSATTRLLTRNSLRDPDRA